VACFHLLHADYMFPSVSWLGSSGAAWSYVFTQHTIGFSMAEGTTAGIALKAHYGTRTTCNKFYLRSFKIIRHCTSYHQHAKQLSILLHQRQLDVWKRHQGHCPAHLKGQFCIEWCLWRLKSADGSDFWVPHILHQWVLEFVTQYWFSMYYSSRDI